MASGAEFSAAQRRIVESDYGSDAVGDDNLAAHVPIQFHFYKPVWCRDAAFEMLKPAEARRDFRARISGRLRLNAKHPGRQIVGGRRRPRVTSAPSAGA